MSDLAFDRAGLAVIRQKKANAKVLEANQGKDGGLPISILLSTVPAREAATRVGLVILASVFGMSFGGWVSGVIFDATGSYAAAFMNGLVWNALNIIIMVSLLIRAWQRLALA